MLLPAYQNEVKLRGMVSKDPEARWTNAHKTETLTFRVETKGQFCKTLTASEDEKPTWHTVKVFSPDTVKALKHSLYKGDWVLLNGYLATRVWEYNGQKQYQTYIVIDTQKGGHIVKTDVPDKQEAS